MAGATGQAEQHPGRYPPINDYALIGDCRGAGLVSRDGSLDWLCFPRFDSPSLFSALLDAERGGRFRIRPTGAFEVERRYVPDTNIVEMTFRTPGGVCRLRDFMPVASEAEKAAALTPDHEVLREVVGVEGSVELEVVYEPRPLYGLEQATIERRAALGLWCNAGAAALILRSELPLEIAPDRCSAHGLVRIEAGERRYLSLSYSEDAPAVVPLLGDAARARAERTERWWRAWAGRLTYRGPYREAVMRSALALKLMSYAPSGAIIAAPTTSLPERIGGVRNWDYRYCWLRDASFTLRALFALGFREEAAAFFDWMLHATRLTHPELQVVYDIFGEPHLREQELPHLEGYERSRPVRIGNAASEQLQLDVYGVVANAIWLASPFERRFDRDTTRMLNGLGRVVCERWREPDEGIWEVRSGRAHYTHSKALCWVALDRLVVMHEDGRLRGGPVELFRREREAIRVEIETRGYNTELQSYTRTLDGDDVDASLLTLVLYGYVDATDPRAISTCQRIRARLGSGPLIHRYRTEDVDDGLPPSEGAFGVCGFWAVECMARAGDHEAARAAFEQLLGYSNDVGLFAEQFDTTTGAALGNFPQAFTHVGLIDAALTLFGTGRDGGTAASGAAPGENQRTSEALGIEQEGRGLARGPGDG